MSATVYLVYTEECYGGPHEEKRVFLNKPAAEVYQLDLIEKTRGQVDVLIAEMPVYN